MEFSPITSCVGKTKTLDPTIHRLFLKDVKLFGRDSPIFNFSLKQFSRCPLACTLSHESAAALVPYFAHAMVLLTAISTRKTLWMSLRIKLLLVTSWLLIHLLLDTTRP